DGGRHLDLRLLALLLDASDCHRARAAVKWSGASEALVLALVSEAIVVRVRFDVGVEQHLYVSRIECRAGCRAAVRKLGVQPRHYVCASRPPQGVEMAMTRAGQVQGIDSDQLARSDRQPGVERLNRVDVPGRHDVAGSVPDEQATTASVP